MRSVLKAGWASVNIEGRGKLGFVMHPTSLLSFAKSIGPMFGTYSLVLSMPPLKLLLFKLPCTIPCYPKADHDPVQIFNINCCPET